jgi:dTMP kinase
VGKSTQARLLAGALAQRGLPVLLTREPGGAPGAERLRELLLSGETDWTLPAEVLLHFAARAEHVGRRIRPALAAGTWVICDRFYDSTMAYQGYGQGANRAMIAALSREIGLRPDLTIVLDLGLEAAQLRLASRARRPDRYERMDHAFHARVRTGFLEIVAEEPDRCVLVQGGESEEEIESIVARLVWERLS